MTQGPAGREMGGRTRGREEEVGLCRTRTWGEQSKQELPSLCELRNIY